MRKLTLLKTLLCLILALLPGCGAQPPSPPGQIKVAASIPPLADFVRQVGGQRVVIETLVPPGASVHTYEPSPQQARFVAEADVLVLNGVGLEFWADDVVDAAGNAQLLVVDTSQGIAILQEEEKGHTTGNPHVWLNPRHAIVQVEHIRDALSQADPAHRDEYARNAQAYVAQLESLDKEIEAEVHGWAHREFISFHAAFAYFAQRYGLKQAAIIEESPGKEPSPDYLAQVVDIARRLPARAIFAEPQLSPKVARTIAEESGKQVIILDPLGGVAGRETYVELMRYNVAQMAEALK